MQSGVFLNLTDMTQEEFTVEAGFAEFERMTATGTSPAPTSYEDLMQTAMNDGAMEPNIHHSDAARGHALGVLDLTIGPKGFAVSAGYGYYEGESAIAAGMAYGVSDNMSIQGKADVTQDGDTGAGVSLNWKF